MFKPGDKLKIGKNTVGEKEGQVYTAVEKLKVAGVWIDVLNKEVLLDYVHKGYKTTYADFTLEGIAKPILEERKVGKIEMDLFDSGFPNAILEVAKVMTWAGQNKGYKPHDWTNLPNAEVEFSAAASRHKMKSLIQKVDGVVAQERVDEESGIVHLAHEAFNVLAQLELVLRGKIK